MQEPSECFLAKLCNLEEQKGAKLLPAMVEHVHNGQEFIQIMDMYLSKSIGQVFIQVLDKYLSKSIGQVLSSGCGAQHHKCA